MGTAGCTRYDVRPMMEVTDGVPVLAATSRETQLAVHSGIAVPFHLMETVSSSCEQHRISLDKRFQVAIKAWIPLQKDLSLQST